MKRIRIMISSLLFLSLLIVTTSCSSKTSNNQFDASRIINVISREDGSGTRGAFIDLLGIEFKKNNGATKDMTTKEAIIAKQTDVMMINIAGDKYAIGYISLGSLNNTIKAVPINGVIPSAENIKNGNYLITRPFNIATQGEPDGLEKDFIDFILSADGQKIISQSYINIADNAIPYQANKPSGKIVVAGSSSIAPIMEKLKEVYLQQNPNAAIEIQQSDSSAGMNGVIEGTCDIGMASRELKNSELSELTPIRIALDGIVIIVNNDNPITTLTTEQVRSIFTGEIETWSEVQ